MDSNLNAAHREPWNKGKIVGQKAPFSPSSIWESTASCAGVTSQAGNRRRGDCGQGSGRMFWFMRKKFAGSYRALICWSRL